MLSNIYALIDSVVQDQNRTISRVRLVEDETLSVLSNSTPLCVFHDDGSTTIPHPTKPFLVVHKRCTPAPVRKMRYMQRHLTVATNNTLPRQQLSPVAISTEPTSTKNNNVQVYPTIGIPLDRNMVLPRTTKATMENELLCWNEFQSQSSGDQNEMVDDGVVLARLSEHILSPRPSKQEILEI